MTEISLYGVKNVLKKDDSSGSQSVAAPSSLSAWGNYVTTTVVAHNLGYIPLVRVYFESSATDGKVYPAGGRRLAGTYLGLPANSVFCLFEVSTTNVTIYLESFTTKTGSRTIYYNIYKDF